MLPFAWLMHSGWGSSAVYAAELAANLFGALTAIFLIRYVLISRVPSEPAK